MNSLRDQMAYEISSLIADEDLVYQLVDRVFDVMYIPPRYQDLLYQDLSVDVDNNPDVLELIIS